MKAVLAPIFAIADTGFASMDAAGALGFDPTNGGWGLPVALIYALLAIWFPASLI